MRVLLVGGTSNTGKSTVARLLADRLGFDCRSTDLLARHPGRPWPTPTWTVPPHVREHYATLGVDDLITSVLDHYNGLWPTIEELIASHALAAPDSPGLVLEGSALRPGRVAELTVAHTAAVWLTADEATLASRMYAASRYDGLEEDQRLLVDKFLARAVRFQELLCADLVRLRLTTIDAGEGRSPEMLCEDVLAALGRPPGSSP